MRYRPAADVGIAEAEGLFYVAHLPQGPLLALNDSASLIWAIATTPGPGSVEDRVGELVGVPPESIAEGVRELLATMVRSGYLVPADVDPPGTTPAANPSE